MGEFRPRFIALKGKHHINGKRAQLGAGRTRGKSGGGIVAMYVFNTAGEAVGFVFECLIYDLEGTPLGRILGSRVHRIDGSYVGEWFHNMVVARRPAIPRPISPISTPPRRPAMSPCAPRTPAAEHARYPDAFHLLYDGQVTALAAE